MKCAVVGLGKVGSVMAALYASSGHEVIGVDLDQGIIDAINRGTAPHVEPNLASLINSARGRLWAQSEISEEVAGSEIIFIIVPTPSLPSGLYNHGIVLEVLSMLGGALKASKNVPTVVVTSTVTPQACSRELIPALERSSGRRLGEGFEFVYSPQFIALGDVARNLAEPDFVLVGEGSPEAGATLENFLAGVVADDTPFFRMSTTSAEIAKIAVNSFATMKISFANMIGEICRASGNADTGDVLSAVGADKRIGSAYLKAGLGYGGPCFPRDNAALNAYAEAVGVDAPIPQATDKINDRQPAQILDSVLGLDPPPKVVAVMGLAYKPDTPVVEKSQSVEVANLLAGQGFTVRVFDPLVGPGTCDGLDTLVYHGASVGEVLEEADVVIIATPWPNLANELAPLPGVRIIDPWRILTNMIG